MKQPSLNRRQFLQIGLGLGMACWLGAPTVNSPSMRSEQGAGNLAALLRHQASAQIIGQHYLQRYPDEANADQLFSLITAGVDQSVDVQQVRTQLSQRIRQDFADEQVVNLQGWLLARTEARLCALATLV